MRLGFYYHIPVMQSEGKIYVPGYLGRFLDELAGNFSELVLFLHKPNQDENVNFDYQIQAHNVSLILLPERKSAPYRLIHSRKFSRIIRDNTTSIDAFLLRGPTLLLPSLVNAVGSIPIILMIVGDYLAGINSLPQPGWRKTLIRLMETANFHKQRIIARKSLVFVNSKNLFDQYNGIANKLIETRTTTLTKDDFFVREDTCQNRPIRLLYTGRMDPSKGLLDMVKALGLLVQQGEDVVLDFVGWSEANSDIIDQLNSSAKQEGVEDRVFYHGYKSVGPDLFAYYKLADIYLTASQASEGFPRTIWEAMAHSLPVVATNVGSIPDLINDCALIIPPKSPVIIVDAINKLVCNTTLRQKLIRLAFTKAQSMTLEVHVKNMCMEIANYLPQN